jgi:hypothetical protein
LQQTQGETLKNWESNLSQLEVQRGSQLESRLDRIEKDHILSDQQLIPLATAADPILERMHEVDMQHPPI